MTDTRTAYQLKDARRRIRNILDYAPASGWTLEESRAVLEALSAIVRARQEDGCQASTTTCSS